MRMLLWLRCRVFGHRLDRSYEVYEKSWDSSYLVPKEDGTFEFVARTTTVPQFKMTQFCPTCGGIYGVTGEIQ